MPFRTILNVIVIAIGLFTVVFIASQLVVRGPAAAREARALDVEIRSIHPPATAVQVKRNVSWKPGRALASEYYETPQSQTDIRNYYAAALPLQGWLPGAGPKSGLLSGIAMVYHKNNREFHLSF